MKMLCALAMVLIEDVPEAFTQVVEYIEVDESHLIADYFRSQWMIKVHLRQWNCYLRILAGDPKTINNNEVHSRQFYGVYRSVAFFLDYKDRTQLPEGLEGAIKAQWSELGKTFVGYKEA
ncbi:hypothetical protein R1sor_013803 [Riccia sorocarpa]|uniref:Uncharacterized protein n=1 Tax=Riccia sorocarpa TaxID=122646 RepID=A0ABD3HAH2_9MARC